MCYCIVIVLILCLWIASIFVFRITFVLLKMFKWNDFAMVPFEDKVIVLSFSELWMMVTNAHDEFEFAFNISISHSKSSLDTKLFIYVWVLCAPKISNFQTLILVNKSIVLSMADNFATLATYALKFFIQVCDYKYDGDKNIDTSDACYCLDSQPEQI